MTKRKKTTVLTPSDIERQWHLVDASADSLGRVATVVARLLTGKDKPGFTPNLDNGDFVVVTNTDSIKTTGRKAQQKSYYRHSGHPGNLKSKTLGQSLQQDSTKVFISAVFGMLPKNKLRSGRMLRLKVYPGSEHPHEAQEPKQVKVER